MFADPEALYRQTTAASRALHEKAVAVMPGGTTRTTTYFDPYPLYIDRGEGCRVWDADGRTHRFSRQLHRDDPRPRAPESCRGDPPAGRARDRLRRGQPDRGRARDTAVRARA